MVVFMENWKGGYLYRYRKWDKNTKKILLDGEFFYAGFHALNDPNEGKNISDDLIKTVIKDYLIPIERNPSLQDHMKNDLKLWDKNSAIPRRYKKTIKEHIAEMGIVCLTTKPDNNPMWHFYADSNAGICIEFYFPEAYSHNYKYLCPCPISYKPLEMCTDNLSEILVFNKDQDWAYENEYRLIERDLKDSSQRIKKFPVEKMLCSVIAGHNMPNHDFIELKKIIGEVNKKYRTKVTLHRRIMKQYGPVKIENEEKWNKRNKGLKFIGSTLLD